MRGTILLLVSFPTTSKRPRMSTDLVLEPLEMPPRAASPFAEEAEDKMHEQVVQARLWKIFTQEMTTYAPYG